MTAKRIFITGGASGFGKALAQRYARAGYRVCIGDVHEARGEEAVSALCRAGHDALFIRCDVTQEADLVAVAAELDRAWGGVDVVVNNAGVAAGGGIAETPLEDWAWIVDINLLGVVRGCKAFTPVFRRQGGGTFVNVSSMAGLIHPPMMSAYNATKAAVVALSETLAVELARDGVRVSVVCPGFFRTNLTETMRTTNPDVAKMTGKLVNQAVRDADDIADYTFRAVSRGDFHVLPHPEGRAIWALKRLSPWAAYVRVLKNRTQRMLGRQAS